MGKWISMAAVAVTMLWIGLMGTVVLVFVYPEDSNLPHGFIFSPLVFSLLGVGAFLLSESGVIGWLCRSRGATRGDEDREVAEAEFYQMLKEGDEWLANYKETLSKLASKRG